MGAGGLSLERLPGAVVVSGRGVRAVFTGREGPVRGNLGGANLSRTVGDDEDAVAAVREWAAALARLAPAALAWGPQVHGCRGHRVDAAAQGRGTLAPSLPETDGLVSATPGVGLGVLAADCLPVLLAGDAAVGVVHAGWKGVVGGILGAAVAALSEVPGGTAPVGVIGPSIGPCCFEVGPEVAAHFEELWPEVVIAGGDGRRHVDLGGAAVAALDAAGVPGVEILGPCTRCGTGFFSHRRGDVGRQGLVAGVVDA